MKKKILVSLIVLSGLSLYAAEGNTNENNTNQESEVQLEQQGKLKNKVQVQNNNLIANQALELSKKISALAEKMAEITTNADDKYTQATLEVSSQLEIITKQMEKLSTQINPIEEIENDNFELIQNNLLNIQTQLSQTLSNLSLEDKEIVQEMAKVKNQIQSNLQNIEKSIGFTENNFKNTQQTKALEEVQKAVKLSPFVKDLVEILDNVKPQYRYIVVNAIKQKLAQTNQNMRQDKLSELKQSLNSIRNMKQRDLALNNSAMEHTKVDLDKAFNAGGENRGISSGGMDSNIGSTASSAGAGAAGSSGGSTGGM